MTCFFSNRGQDIEVESIVEYDSTANDFNREDLFSQPKQGENQELKKVELQKTKSDTTNSSYSTKIKESWLLRTMGRNKLEKKKSKMKKKVRYGKHKKSTMSMRKHHHETFAHLIQDALIRLKCSPIHHLGFSKRSLARNIERHYKLKLGKKFHLRLRKSLKKLVRESNMVCLGNKRSGIRYKPIANFLEHFARLKVIDGTANGQFGVKIQYKSRSRSSTSRSRSSSQSRDMSRGKKNQCHSQSHPQSKRQSNKSNFESQDSERCYHSESHHSKKSKDFLSSYKPLGSSSIASWLWPSKKEKSLNDRDNAPKVKEAFLRGYQLGNESCKRKGGGQGQRYKKFKQIRIREHTEASSPRHYPSPTTSRQGSLTDSSSMQTEFSSQKSKDSILDTLDSNAKDMDKEEFPEHLRQVEENDVDDKTSNKSEDEMTTTTIEDQDTSEATSQSSATSSRKHKSMEEHNTLHSLKKSSEGSFSANGSSSKSFLGKLTDSFHSALSSSSTSHTSSKNHQDPTRSQNPSKLGPTFIRTSESKKSGSRDPKFPLSPRFANLLQE